MAFQIQRLQLKLRNKILGSTAFASNLAFSEALHWHQAWQNIHRQAHVHVEVKQCLSSLMEPWDVSVPGELFRQQPIYHECQSYKVRHQEETAHVISAKPCTV